MIDKDLYGDIAPLEGEKAAESALYIKNHPEFLEHILKLLFKSAEKRNPDTIYTLYKSSDDVIRTFYFLLGGVASWKDFQEKLVTSLIMPLVILGTTDGITIEGVERIDVNEPHVFISTHRDIILDSAFLVYAMMQNKGMCVQAAAGSNLYINKEASSYFGLLGCVKVFRGLNLREEYEASKRLSSYIYDNITSKESSIWIAGGAGRAKDGVDKVYPSIIKMMALSHRKEISYTELVKKLSIVPMAISYEKNPNAISMAKEIISSVLLSAHIKRPMDDYVSIVRGISKYKGHITISFDSPLDGEYSSSEEIAAEVEKRIRLIYKLYPFNYYAYDKVNKTDRFKDRYSSFSEEEELKKFKSIKMGVGVKVLEAYAAPVASKLLYTDDV